MIVHIYDRYVEISASQIHPPIPSTHIQTFKNHPNQTMLVSNETTQGNTTHYDIDDHVEVDGIKYYMK